MQITSAFKACDLAYFPWQVSEALEFATTSLSQNIQQLRLLIAVRGQNFSHGQCGSHLFRMNEMTETSLHG